MSIVSLDAEQNYRRARIKRALRETMSRRSRIIEMYETGVVFFLVLFVVVLFLHLVVLSQIRQSLELIKGESHGNVEKVSE